MMIWPKIRKLYGAGRRALWIGFLLSGPASLVICRFLIFAVGDGSSEPLPWFETKALDYQLFYYTILGVLAVRRLFRNWRLGLFTFAAVVLVAVGSWFAMPLAATAGFVWYIYPEKAFLLKHCHPKSFVQDGKTFYLGMCDLEYVDDGQTDFSYFYDTSKDIENDQEAKEAHHTKDRQEFVSAVRALVRDDPNEIFEISNFHTSHVYGHFYEVDFDVANAEGFTSEYGVPPYNKKNLYPPAF